MAQDPNAYQGQNPNAYQGNQYQGPGTNPYQGNQYQGQGPNAYQNPNAGNEYRQEIPNIQGTDLLEQVKNLLHEGNVRRIIIKQEGHTIVEIPLTVGVVGVIVAPALAAIGAIGALIAHCSIEVVRSEQP